MLPMLFRPPAARFRDLCRGDVRQAFAAGLRGSGGVAGAPPIRFRSPCRAMSIRFQSPCRSDARQIPKPLPERCPSGFRCRLVRFRGCCRGASGVLAGRCPSGSEALAGAMPIRLSLQACTAPGSLPGRRPAPHRRSFAAYPRAAWCAAPSGSRTPPLPARRRSG